MIRMNMNNIKVNGYILVLSAASLWATLGLFYKSLVNWYGMSLIEIVFWRASIASIILFIVLLISSRFSLRISGRDVWVFIGLGTVGVAGFFAIYIYAIDQIGMGIAAVLLYTAPFWVTIFSIFILKERITIVKIISLILTLAGMILVGYKYYITDLRFGALGIAAGLGAGLGYASHILLSKSAVQKGYSPWAVNAYGFGIGALILLIFQNSNELIRAVSDWRILFWLFLLGLLPTLGGGVAFYSGLRRMPASDASIIATLEPVIAAVLGWAVYSENLEVSQIVGGLLIVGSVILLQFSQRKSESNISVKIKEGITDFGADTQ